MFDSLPIIAEFSWPGLILKINPVTLVWKPKRELQKELLTLGYIPKSLKSKAVRNLLRQNTQILAAASAKSLQSCPTLCDPVDGSPPGSPVPGILQARTLEWVAISFSNAWKWKVKVKSLSHMRLSNPMDCSPPGSSARGIFQARVLEWGAILKSLM